MTKQCSSCGGFCGKVCQREDIEQSTIKQSLTVEPVAWMHTQLSDVAITHRPADLDRHPDRWTALYSEPKPCPTCESLARAVMMDQTGRDA